MFRSVISGKAQTRAQEYRQGGSGVTRAQEYRQGGSGVQRCRVSLHDFFWTFFGFLKCVLLSTLLSSNPCIVSLSTPAHAARTEHRAQDQD